MNQQQGMGLIQVHAESVEALATFYHCIVGLPLKGERVDSHVRYTGDVQGVTFEILEATKERTAGRNHIRLAVSDVEKTARYLELHGARRGRQSLSGDFIRTVALEDPEKNVLELVSIEDAPRFQGLVLRKD